MKNFLFVIFLISATLLSRGQDVNGYVINDYPNVTIVKVYGTHQERGYAVGYLLAEKIKDLYENYIIPAFGTMLPTAKTLLSTNNHIVFDSVYIYEAMAMVEGINDAGYSMEGVDYLDILIANSFLDIENISAKGLGLSNGCSSLLSWGSATEGTDLNNKAVISRHMDWNTDYSLIRNQVIVVHFPSEENEHPWLLIGFAGQMSVLSGFNQSGLAVMQHMLADNYASGGLFKGYEPIWISMRKALEINDFNQDDVNNVMDVRDVLLENENGYAESYIVTALSHNVPTQDSLVAAIIEMTPDIPYFSVRDNKYPDSIPGDNIYAANSSISRNNYMHFCSRYNAVRANMGDGTGIGYAENWAIMKEFSSSCAFGGTGNIQFMQFCPEDGILRLALHDTLGVQGCENDSLVFYSDDLFSLSVGNEDLNEMPHIRIFPNPFSSFTNVYVSESLINKAYLEVLDLFGKRVRFFKIKHSTNTIDNLSRGIYFVRIISGDKCVDNQKIVVAD